MIYADADYYQNEYLLGRGAIIPPSEFGYWARMASIYLDRITFNRIEAIPMLEAVRMAACEIAEAYYADSENKRPDNIKSESTGGHSVTYADQRQTTGELTGSLRAIAARWLADTGLLFRGV